ncbi:Arginine--pyruvate transaminase AruH [Roseivivax jejudonensis]|uniref:Aminotransferase n=1 Tax=Roseivivax jejudonensis TaxID=1529041 RepID=A0A1X6YS13_9RHOB|nr:pyridoxal phosphate-dependent aminotransferase [Roseivivax jejudonensis]SLN29742.1 Arginine--pyruvate transaminase AruH [Roseivivax jejudonensis]
MPELSTRITGLNEGGADGWEIHARARALRTAGAPVTDLTIGEHDTPTDGLILDAMNDAARAGLTGYAPGPGMPELREAVAARVSARTGVATARDNVLIVPGGQAGLFAAHMALCDPGDISLHVDPYYATYPGTIRAVGARPRAVATRAEDGFLPTRAALDAAAHGARTLLVNTPNNPTGAVYPRATLDDIAAVAAAHDLWVISDEVYDTQIWEGTHLSPRALPGMAARTLVIGSMSKGHAMTGSRIGWVVGPDDAIARLRELATVTTYGVPGFIQEAARAALRAGTDLEARIAEPFRRRRALAIRHLTARDIGVLPAQGAMYLMLDIRATGRSGLSFAHELLERHAIAVMPGESFGSAAAGHVRVALTVDDDALADALDALAGFAAGLARAA